MKEPYPNKEFTIWFDAIKSPNVAGSDNNKDNSIDLFCIKLTLFLTLFLILFVKLGKATVPTAMPAIARLIW